MLVLKLLRGQTARMTLPDGRSIEIRVQDRPSKTGAYLSFDCPKDIPIDRFRADGQPVEGSSDRSCSSVD